MSVISSTDGNILEFVNKFQKKFKSLDDAKAVFCDGYCYHFAKILDDLFSGLIVYDPINNHFAFEGACGGVFDITGKIGDVEDIDNGDFPWVDWGKFIAEEPTESGRIIRQCLYKIYEEE